MVKAGCKPGKDGKCAPTKRMMEKSGRTLLFYASSHDCCSDLFIEVELSSDLNRKKEEKLLDNLMEKLYAEYNQGMGEIIKEYNAG